MNNFKNVLYLIKKDDKAYLAFIPKLFKLATRHFKLNKFLREKKMMERISKGNYTSRETCWDIAI
jgi:hypothetical protein